MSCQMMKFNMAKRKSPKKSKSRKSPKRSQKRKSMRKSIRRSRSRKSPKKSKSRKSPRKSPKVKKTTGCSLQHTKKYITRPSPAYPANQCCGSIMIGNDKYLWQSRPDSRGVCHWYKF